MKKKLMIGLITGGLVLGGAFAVGAANNNFTKAKAENTKQLLSLEDAKKIATDKYGGYIESVELEQGKFIQYYEVDVKTDQEEIDLTIDAYSGKILDVEKDFRDNENEIYPESEKQMKTEAQVDSVSMSTQRKNLLTQEEAIQIAEKETGAKVVEIDLDQDDGRYEYEMELRSDKTEYDITLDAITGSILDYETDYDDRFDD